MHQRITAADGFSRNACAHVLISHILANHQSFTCACICVLSTLLHTVLPQCPFLLHMCVCSTLLGKHSAFKTLHVPIKAANVCACLHCLLDSKHMYHPGGVPLYAFLCWLYSPQQWFSAFLVGVCLASSPTIWTSL